jgi:hypothetical protein
VSPLPPSLSNPNRQHGNVAAPTSTNGEPMTRTVYWYPDPADPEAEWLSATWTDSFIPATSPTPVTAGTIAETVASVSGVTAAADSAQVQTTNGAISRAAPAVGAVVAAVLAAAL